MQTVLIQFSFQHRSVDLAMRLHGCDDQGGQALQSGHAVLTALYYVYILAQLCA